MRIQKGEFFIEWDDDKARKNIRDHGIDFFEASEVFEDPFVIQNGDGQLHNELRFVDLGKSRKNRCLVVVYTWRGERTHRIISARKADATETRQYEEL